MIIGIDPGSVSAAYAVLDSEGAIVDVGDVPVVDRMVDGSEFARIVGRLRPREAIVELVSAMPRQGVTSSFRFGMGCGILRGVLLAAGVPLYQVPATKWKKYFRLDNDAEKSRAMAIRIWPTCEKLSRKKDHGRAEALLLARYHQETRR
jgi:Holliday junction resolvasome RuvABC endonuclease subunit